MSNSGKVLAEYMRRVDEGKLVNVDEICLDYPEIAEELRSYLEGAAMVENLLKVSETSQSGSLDETLKPVPNPTPDQNLVGKLFGRYRVTRHLGEGAMGAVFLAHDTHLKRLVALKVPKCGDRERADFMARFQREAQAAAKLNHQGICAVYDFGEIDERAFITMAYIDGQPLSRFIGSSHVNNRWIADIIRQIANSLQHAHDQGVVHRDLKPGNILVDKRGNVVVTDFGLARHVEQTAESRITREGDVLGTPAYMSPEQVEGKSDNIGPATDIYALGVVLFELLTGELPFRGSIPSILAQITRDEPPDAKRLNPLADQELCDLSSQMMAKEISHRPASMRVVVDRLTEWESEPSLQELAKQQKKERLVSELENRKQKVAELIRRAQYAQAISLLENLSAMTDAEAVGFATWARSELERVKELPKRVRESIPSLISTAKQLIKHYDYGQAAEILQQIPQEMRTSEIRKLLDQSIERQDEAAMLLEDLQDCVNRQHFRGIEDNVQRLLELKPNNRFAQELWKTLGTYSKVPARERKYRISDNGDLLPDDSPLNRIVISGVLVAFLSFCAMTYAVTIYLKTGNVNLSVVVDEEILKNGTIRLAFDGTDYEISGPEFHLNVKPGVYGYEVWQGETIVRNPQRFIVKKGEKNLLEIKPATNDDLTAHDISVNVASGNDRSVPENDTTNPPQAQLPESVRDSIGPIDIDYRLVEQNVTYFSRPDGSKKGINDGILYWNFSEKTHGGGPLVYNYEDGPDDYECELVVRLNELGFWWTLPRVGNETLSHHVKMYISPTGYRELSRTVTDWRDGQWIPDEAKSERFPVPANVASTTGEWMNLRVIHSGPVYDFYKDGNLIYSFTDSHQTQGMKCVRRNLVKLWLLPERSDSGRFEIRSIMLKPLLDDSSKAASVP